MVLLEFNINRVLIVEHTTQRPDWALQDASFNIVFGSVEDYRK